MLKRLSIKNYILIDGLEIEPSTTFNVITGQTGAGKSILLGALGLLMGERLEGKVASDDKCIIEGEFESLEINALLVENDLDVEPSLTIRREVSSQGKSRAFVNDTPVTLEVLKKLTSHLIDIHSQYDTQKLATNTFQLSVIDQLAQNQSVVSAYKSAFAKHQSNKKNLDQLLDFQTQALSQKDINSFFLKEIESLKLNDWDFEEAESQLSRLENAESIKSKLLIAAQSLDGEENTVLHLLKTAYHSLSPLTNYSPAYHQLADRLSAAKIELSDIAAELYSQADMLNEDPERLQALKTKVDGVNALLLKHRYKQVVELIALENELRQKCAQADNIDFEIGQAKKAFLESKLALEQAAAALSLSRRSVCDEFCASLLKLLSSLGMPHARFEIDFKSIEPDRSGADEVVFLFSANKGHKPEELAKVASGGEFSRLMLAIKYLLAQKSKLATLIFDEIDTGISGEITVKVAAMIKDISRNHQVFVITHQPLMAAGAVAHYVVYKQETEQKTISKIKELDQNGRLKELAVMIAGANPPESALQSASEMMLSAQ